MTPAILASDPANFLRTNGASYIRIGSICVAGYEWVLFNVRDTSTSWSDYNSATCSLCLPSSGSIGAKRHGGLALDVFCSFSSGKCFVKHASDINDELWRPRYLSIITIVVSNTGFFAKFTEAQCQQYYMAAPVFKGNRIEVSLEFWSPCTNFYAGPLVLQTMVSQIILGIRLVTSLQKSV